MCFWVFFPFVVVIACRGELCVFSGVVPDVVFREVEFLSHALSVCVGDGCKVMVAPELVSVCSDVLVAMEFCVL